MAQAHWRLSGRDERNTVTLFADAHGPSTGSGQASACMPGYAVARISARRSNGCAAISPARRVANERLKRDGSGDVVLQLKSAWRDGTTHIVMLPLEFMQRLAALVPRPRLHLIRFHGVLAPNAGLRAAIVPGASGKPGEHPGEHARAPARMSWARLLTVRLTVCRAADIVANSEKGRLNLLNTGQIFRSHQSLLVAAHAGWPSGWRKTWGV